MRLPSPIAVRPILPLLEQHVEDAALHWMRRQGALVAPHYHFENHLGEPGGDLGHLDRRLQVHLDGARLGGELAWQLARDLLAIGEAPEVFVASILALQPYNASCLEAILAVVMDEPRAVRGLVSALGWLPFAQIQDLARSFALADAPLIRAVGLAAFAVHRREPPNLVAALDDPASFPRRRALKAVAELARRDLLRHVASHLDDEDPACRYEAARSSALLHDKRGVDALLQMIGGAELTAPNAESAARVVGLTLSASSLDPWVRQWARCSDPNLNRAAIAALGVCGDPAAVPELLTFTMDPSLARLSGEALSRITGINIADGFEAEPPEGFVPGPSDDPNDDDVDLDPDEDLPWPDPDTLLRWWGAHSSAWRPGQRYLLGRPITVSSLAAILRSGAQRERVVAAHHLLSWQAAPLFEYRAPSCRQLLTLATSHR